MMVLTTCFEDGTQPPNPSHKSLDEECNSTTESLHSSPVSSAYLPSSLFAEPSDAAAGDVAATQIKPLLAALTIFIMSIMVAAVSVPDNELALAQISAMY